MVHRVDRTADNSGNKKCEYQNWEVDCVLRKHDDDITLLETIIEEILCKSDTAGFEFRVPMKAVISKLDTKTYMEVASHLSPLPGSSSRYNTLSRSSSVSDPLQKTNSHRGTVVSSTSGYGDWKIIGSGSENEVWVSKQL